MLKAKAKKRKDMAPDIRTRHMIRQKKRRKRRILFRTVLLLIFLTSACSAAVFLTPWFHITSVDVHGNHKVPSDQIVAATGIAVGNNTFQVSLTRAHERVTKLPYIKTAKLSRRLFPAKVIVEVTESRLSGYIPFAGGFIGFDEDGKVVEIMVDKPAGVPAIKGVNLLKYEPGYKMELESTGQADTILIFIDEFRKAGLLEDITELDVTNLMDVKFRYQDRLKIYCGDDSDLERKLLTFKEVALNQLLDTDKGEIDLTVRGKAYYRP